MQPLTQIPAVNDANIGRPSAWGGRNFGRTVVQTVGSSQDSASSWSAAVCSPGTGWHGSCTVAEVHQSLGNSGTSQRTSAVTGAQEISCCNCNPRNLLLNEQGAPAASFLSSLVGVLQDLFSLNLPLESESKRRSIVTDALAKHFNLPAEALTKATSTSPPVQLEANKRVSNPSLSSLEAEAVCSEDDLAVALGVQDFELIPTSDLSDMDLATQSGSKKDEWPVIPPKGNERGKAAGRKKGPRSGPTRSSSRAEATRRSSQNQQRLPKNK